MRRDGDRTVTRGDVIIDYDGNSGFSLSSLPGRDEGPRGGTAWDGQTKRRRPLTLTFPLAVTRSGASSSARSQIVAFVGEEHVIGFRPNALNNGNP
ncbi:hypothetical protein AAFF_G00130070 [Aldrovandia affinis]|uniref:Uncharacterized protein n=1 Tax=Aldrovandia affinis TaxID=143900 RepID=A0AAD7RR08_9TELE|nr:hypothetical protein AAFF_G00130070 [Aldrovandia affinis]